MPGSPRPASPSPTTPSHRASDPSAPTAPRQHPPSPPRSRPGAAGGTSCSPGSAQKLPPGWPGRGGEQWVSTHVWASTHGRASTHGWASTHGRVWDAGSWRGEIQALVGTGSTSPVHGRDTAAYSAAAPAGTHVSRELGRQGGHLLLRGLQLAAQLADLLWGESRGREKGRALAPAAVAGAGDAQRARAHLGLHLLLSLAAREQRETDRQSGQSGGQRGRTGSARGRGMHRAPRAHPGPPSHAASSAAQQWLLQRSRWRTRWKPGTALIRELQQNKTRRVRVLQSVPPLGLQLQDTAGDSDGAPRAGEAPQGPGEAGGETVAAQHCSCLGMWLVTPQGTWSSLHLLPPFQLSLGALSPSLTAWDPPIPSATTPWDHPRDTRHPWGQGWL